MSTQVTSSNPVVQAIVSGKAPQAARLAAARGLLPLAQADLLEALVALQSSEDKTIASAATATLQSQAPEELLSIAQSNETAPSVLGYLAARQDASRNIHEAAALNVNTPDEAIALLAGMTTDSSLLEAIAINQQRLIRTPAIIEALIHNPATPSEVERRAHETRREFFEKERGAKQIAEELRARGQTAAAEFMESAESVGIDQGLTIEDAWLIAQHIEVSDADIDDSWLELERLEEVFEESYQERVAAAERIIADVRVEGGAELPPERISLIRRIMLMSVKDRMKLGIKGDREARNILIRDANKIVATAVINNPRITENEVEVIASMRTVSDEVLRLIAMNRSWARSYPIIHNLARNPRTPIATAMSILPRIRTKDLQQISQNRNVSEAVRRQSYRLARTREGH